MSTDRKIALFGIGLSAVGLIPILRDASLQLVVAYCLPFLMLVGFFVYIAYRTSGPQFSTVSLKKVLAVQDKGGALATLTRDQRIRVNYGSIVEIWCRDIYADGTADNFKVDGVAVPTYDQKWSGAIADLRKRFSEAIFSGHESRFFGGLRLAQLLPGNP